MARTSGLRAGRWRHTASTGQKAKFKGRSSGVRACPSCFIRSSASSTSQIDWIPLAAHGEGSSAAVGLSGGGGLAGSGLFITGGLRGCWIGSSAAGSLPPLVAVLPPLFGSLLFWLVFSGVGITSIAAGSLPPLFGVLLPPFGALPPLFGSLAPLFEVLPPLVEALPASFGALPPLFGQLPVFGGGMRTNAAPQLSGGRRQFAS
jgi:hypothetical protein